MIGLRPRRPGEKKRAVHQKDPKDMDTRVNGDRATKDMGLAFPFPACSKLVTHQIIDIVEVAKFVLIIVIVIVIVVHSLKI